MSDSTSPMGMLFRIRYSKIFFIRPSLLVPFMVTPGATSKCQPPGGTCPTLRRISKQGLFLFLGRKNPRFVPGKFLRLLKSGSSYGFIVGTGRHGKFVPRLSPH